MLTTRENALWRQPMLGWPDDRTDISMQAITRTYLRGARWAANSVLTEPISEWLFSLPDLVQAPPDQHAVTTSHPESDTVH